MPTFSYQSTVPAYLAEAFAWHRRPGALLRLMPPWLPARVVRESMDLAVGEQVQLALGPLHVASRHTALTEPDGKSAVFADEMHRGPVRSWHHRHEFTATDAGTLIGDAIDWSAPWLPAPLVTNQLERMFTYRHRQLAADLAAHARAEQHLTGKRLTVAISGASGLLGTQLAAFLTTGGHQVLRLVRRASHHAGEVGWNLHEGTLEADKLASCDAVVHLAGEPLYGRWTQTKMHKIRDSRIVSTRLLAGALAQLPNGPKVLVSASAVGFYANSDEPVGEDGPRGEGFLADVVADWEQAADPAREAGIRVVHPRIGIVLSPRSGFLALQLPAFHAGVGGFLGDGRQQMSWVSCDDTIGMLHHALINEDVAGPLNVTAPTPVTARDLARTLGSVLYRPAWIPIPRAPIRLVMGDQAAQELAGASQCVAPAKALGSGYVFRDPDLAPALRHMLGREK